MRPPSGSDFVACFITWSPGFAHFFLASPRAARCTGTRRLRARLPLVSSALVRKQHLAGCTPSYLCMHRRRLFGDAASSPSISLDSAIRSAATTHLASTPDWPIQQELPIVKLAACCAPTLAEAGTSINQLHHRQPAIHHHHHHHHTISLRMRPESRLRESRLSPPSPSTFSAQHIRAHSTPCTTTTGNTDI